MTFLWGIVLLMRLPDSIDSAGFLNGDERIIAQKRVIAAGMGKHQTAWQFDQCIECLTDPKAWIIFFITVLMQVRLSISHGPLRTEQVSDEVLDRFPLEVRRTFETWSSKGSASRPCRPRWLRFHIR